MTNAPFQDAGALSRKSKYAQRPLHEQPGYKGERVLGPMAMWMFRYWARFPKRRPHQGARECARRVRQMQH